MHLRFVFGFIFIFLLHGCATLQQQDSASQIAAKQAQEYEARGDYQRAADMYWLTAEKMPKGKDAIFRIKGAEMAFVAGSDAQVRAILSRISDTGLNSTELARKRLIAARLAKKDGNSEKAVALLKFPRSGLPIRLQEDIAALLGEKFTVADSADRESIEKQMLQQSQTGAVDQAREVWTQLESLSTQQISQWLGSSKNTLTQGWLELAYLYRSTSDPLSRETGLKAWQEKYRGHPVWPGTAMGVDHVATPGLIEAKVVAVLIPQTGPLEKISQVILEGIKATRRSEQGFLPELRIYDTGDSTVNVVDLYHRAVSEGAGLVIGPMQKSNVALLARERLTVPVLTLNHAEDGTVYNPALFQFALLPEDEARQAARRIYMDGYIASIAFAPEGAWGERILKAFAEQFTELGGQVLESSLYNARENDYSPAIIEALKVRRGEDRHTGTRREDVEAIFVAAAPRQARIFKPLLKFYFAEELPVYATSHAYSGQPNENRDRDLNGMSFTDIPWLLREDPDLTDLIPEPDALTGANRHYPRLFALGIDSYRMAPQVNNFLAVEGLVLQGYSGAISMDQNNRLHRELRWSKFIDGIPEQHYVAEEKR